MVRHAILPERLFPGGVTVPTLTTIPCHAGDPRSPTLPPGGAGPARPVRGSPAGRFAAPLLAVALALAGCPGPTEERLQVDGTVAWADQAGAWVLRADDGRLFQPFQFPAAFASDGLRVRAVLARHDFFSAAWAGEQVEVLDLAALPCEPAACAPPPVAWLYLLGADAGETNAASVAGVMGPAGGPSPAGACVAVPALTDPARRDAACTVVGPGPGTYRVALTAPGYAAQEVVVEVPTRAPPAGACCPVGYPTQVRQVYLNRSP